MLRTTIISVFWLMLLVGCNPHGDESTLEIIDAGFGVTISRSSSQAASASTFPINFDVTFDTSIDESSFTTSDIIQNGNSTSLTWTITHVSDNKNFTLSATAGSDGTVIPSIAANSILTDTRRNNRTSVGVNNSVIFDATIPTITSVTSSSANTCYLVGQSINVDVNFTEAVTVSGGTPTVLLETGAIDQAAAFVSGSGTNTLTFAYTVMSGDSSADLDYTTTAALSLNGATIVDQSGNNAVITLPTVAGGQSLGSNQDLSLPAPNATSPSITVDSTSALTLNWTAAGGSTTGYRVASAVGGTAPADCSTSTDVGNLLTNQETGLILNTQYSYRICSYDPCNNNSDGVTISGTTGRIAFNNLTTTQGLPANDVLGVYVHTNNDIQVSTNTGGWGLSTDGGTNWTNRTTTDGLGSNAVFNSTRDSSGNIFLATSLGVSVSTNGGTSFTNRDNTDGLGNSVAGLGDIARSVDLDTSDNLTASTLNGISTTSNLGAAWTSRTTTDGLPSNTTSYTFINASNNFYTGTFGGGFAVSSNGGVSWTTFNTGDGIANDNVEFVYANAAGTTIYACTQGGLSISTDSGTNWTNRTTADGLPSNTTSEILVDSKGYLYLATSAGLAVSTNGGVNWDTYTTTEGLGSNTIQGLAVDSNGLIYIGTTGGLSISTAAP